MAIKTKSFDNMNIDPRVCEVIKYKRPTSIQAKSIPLILKGHNIIGISSTGSGKTLAYLIPVLHKALNGMKALIIVPTRDLVHQISRVLDLMAKKLGIKVCLAHGGIESNLENYDIIVSTTGKICYEWPNISVDILVVDEIDRIFEEEGMKKEFLEIEGRLKKERQNIYFSATLPDNMIDFISEFKLVQVESKLSKNLQNCFLYVPSPLKESALLFLMSRIDEKTIIFASTKYSVDVIAEILKDRNVRPLYSSMDQSLRKKNMLDFVNDVSKILIVTDLGARGLDIPSLSVVINYDMCDEKIFLHRVGRVARNNKPGMQYSLVSFRDVFNFFRIREKYFPSIEIGSIPHEYLDEFTGKLNKLGIDELRETAEKSSIKALKFIKKNDSQEKYKFDIKDINTHTIFSRDKEINSKDKFRNFFQKKTPKLREVAPIIDTAENDFNSLEKFRDTKFFIPYKKGANPQDNNSKISKINQKKSYIFSMHEDWKKKKKILFKIKRK